MCIRDSQGTELAHRMVFAGRNAKILGSIVLKNHPHTCLLYTSYDALAVIVNPSNPVSQLTRQQLEAIFRGKITNWKQLGGPDMKIIVYSRETSSGTYEFFKESALKNKNYMSSSLSMPATGAVIQSVSQTKGAIGYVGLAYLSPRVKAIAVSYDDGKHYVLPSLENGKKKLYPVVRPLYYLSLIHI